MNSEGRFLPWYRKHQKPILFSLVALLIATLAGAIFVATDIFPKRHKAEADAPYDEISQLMSDCLNEEDVFSEKCDATKATLAKNTEASDDKLRIFAINRLSELYAREGDNDKAAEIINDAIAKESSAENQYFLLYELRSLYMSTNDKEKLIETLQKLHNLVTDSNSALDLGPMDKDVFLREIESAKNESGDNEDQESKELNLTGEENEE